MHPPHFRRGLALTALLALFACEDGAPPTGPADAPSVDPLPAIVDGSSAEGNPGIRFLPPIAVPDELPGTFDSDVPLRIEIDQLVNGEPVGSPQSFSVAAGEIEVNTTYEYYLLWWRPPSGAAAGTIFRARLFAGPLDLRAYADLEVAQNPGHARRILAEGENAPVLADRDYPITAYLNTEAVGWAEDQAAAEFEQQLEQELGTGTVQEAEVVLVDNDEGGSVTVEDDPVSPETGGTVTTFPNQAFLADGTTPASDYVLSAALVSDGSSGGLPLSQQGGPFLIVEAQTVDGADVFFGQVTINGITYVGANVCLTQPAEVDNTYTEAQAAAQDIFRDDDGVFSFHDTQLGSCPSDAVSGTASLQQAARTLAGWKDALSLGRKGLGRLAAYFLPAPLRATHGGLTTISDDGFGGFSGVGAILRTIPAASTADVPQTGVVGAPTVITIQANAVDATGNPVPQANGDDSVRVVVVRGTDEDTLTVVDNEDGTYTAQYTPQSAGTDEIRITIRNIETGDFEAISGSPFTSEVSVSSGAEMIIFGDVNSFDSQALTSSGNTTMIDNIVGFTSSRPRAAGTSVIFDEGRGGATLTLSSYTAATKSYLQGQGYNVTTISSSSGTLISFAADVKVLVLVYPQVTYTASEVTALKDFAANGGRIVFISENEAVSNSATVYAVQNDLLMKLGSPVRNSGGTVDPGYHTAVASQIGTHQTTTGVTELIYAASSVLTSLGVEDTALLVDDGVDEGAFDTCTLGCVLAAAVRIDTAPSASIASTAPPLIYMQSVTDSPTLPEGYDPTIAAPPPS